MSANPIVWVVVEQLIVFEATDKPGEEFEGLVISKVHSAHVSQKGAQATCRRLAREAEDSVAMFHTYPVELAP